MKLLKKITAKDVLGAVNNVVKDMEIDAKQLAYGVAGTCTSFEVGMSQYGEWTRFVGQFEATNYVTGENMRAAKAHVPQVLQDALLAGISESAEVDSTRSTKDTKVFKLANPIEFAFQVEIRRNPDDEKGGISYEYITTPLIDVQQNDAISHLSKMLQLEAPKAEAKAEAVKPAKEKATA